MVPLEHGHNPPQELQFSADKTANPQTITELAAAYFDALKSHASALLGLTPVEAPTSTESASPLPPDVELIRANRRAQFEQTGYIPPVAGGSPKRIELPGDEIVAAYRNQVPVEDIAKQYGVSAVSIYNRLHEVGIRTHPYQPRREEYIEAPMDIEAARLRVEEIFSTKWDKKTTQGKKQYQRALRELGAIWEAHPDLAEEVNKSLYGDEKASYSK